MQIAIYLCVVVVGCLSLERPRQEGTLFARMLLQSVEDTGNTADKRSELTRRLTEEQWNTIETAFKKVDVNGDGHIASDEFAAYVSKINQYYSYDELIGIYSGIVGRVDTNGSGEIEINEFEILVTHGDDFEP